MAVLRCTYEIIFNSIFVKTLVFSYKENLNLYLFNPLLTVKLLLLENYIVFPTQMIPNQSNDMSQYYIRFKPQASKL